MRVRSLGRRQGLRQPALQPQGRDQRGQFHHHHRDREPPHQIGAIEPPGDEQERDTRRQPQEEPGDIGAPALGELRDVAAGGGHAACLARRRSSRRIAGVTVMPCSRIDISTINPNAPHNWIGSSNRP